MDLKTAKHGYKRNVEEEHDFEQKMKKMAARDGTDLEEHFAFGEDFRREGVGLEEVGAEIDCHECRTRLIQRAKHQLHSYGNR
jgi:hypothetical protein